MEPILALVSQHSDDPFALLASLEELAARPETGGLLRAHIDVWVREVRPVVEKRARLERELEATTERLERATQARDLRLAEIAERAARDSERACAEVGRQSAYAAQLRGWIAGVKFDPPKRLLR